MLCDHTSSFCGHPSYTAAVWEDLATLFDLVGKDDKVGRPDVGSVAAGLHVGLVVKLILCKKTVSWLLHYKQSRSALMLLRAMNDQLTSMLASVDQFAVLVRLFNLACFMVTSDLSSRMLVC